MWCASLLLGAALAGGPSLDLQQMATGTFELATTEETADAAVSAGIGASVASIPWAFRGYARDKLKKAAVWCPAWRLDVTEAHLAVLCLPHWRSTLTRRWDAPPEPILASDRTRYGMRMEHGEDWILVVFESEDGDKSHRFAFSEAGVEVTVTVENRRLPVAPRWTLPYARAAR